MSTPTKPNDAYTEYRVPWVCEIPNEAFSYHVESRTNPDQWHKVDLTQRGGHGACTCQHFQIVAAPNFRRHGRFIPYAPKRHGVSECCHIAAARAHFHINVTIPMLARYKNGIPKP